MNWLLTVPLCILLVEIALRLPFGSAVSSMSRSGGMAVHVIRAKGISDHWKERAMGVYARITLLSSLKLAVLLAVLLILAAFLVAALSQISAEFQDFILGWRGIAFSVVLAGLYLTARKSFLHGRL